MRDVGEVALHALHAFSCGLTERDQIEREGEGEREFETYFHTGGPGRCRLEQK